MHFKIILNDNKYNIWSIYDANTLIEITNDNNYYRYIKDFNPLFYKLFSEDTFEIDENNKFSLTHSIIRSLQVMPGVLKLTEQTYGTTSSNINNIPSSRRDKLYYKCIPDDKRIPIFLIPYQENKLNFFKNKVNKYVLFTFNKWNDKHPVGKLIQTIGDVADLVNFYEYQLYCKSLNASINSFTKATSNALKQHAGKLYISEIMSIYKNIENRLTEEIITIDPQNSLDFDDAISIKYIDNEMSNEYIVSIYISNVPIWIDYLNLWESFSNRISTIYLPDRKRPMLPTILSDSLCSLQENEGRLAFCMDLHIKDNIIKKISFKNTLIKVSRNFIYEEEDLINNNMYKNLLKFTHFLSKQYKYMSHIKSSHDLISYYMILMNYECSKFMAEYKNGIYRSVNTKSENPISIPKDMPTDLPKDVSNFIKIWNCSSSQYMLYDNNLSHALIGNGLDTYLHITSPIRRLVDLLNIMKIQENLNIIQFKKTSTIFYSYWESKLDYINTTMRSIRKIQNDCYLLDLCIKKPEIMNDIYEGYLFDKIKRNDGLYKYMVYLPFYNMVSSIILKTSLVNYNKVSFKLYLFTNEATFKRKIRLQLIDIHYIT